MHQCPQVSPARVELRVPTWELQPRGQATQTRRAGGGQRLLSEQNLETLFWLLRKRIWFGGARRAEGGTCPPGVPGRSGGGPTRPGPPPARPCHASGGSL